MNVITLIGNLCKDVELRYSASGKPILDNTIGVRKDKKVNGNYESDFIRIVLFDHNAEFLNKYGKKGDRISIVGKLRVDNYQDKEGNYKTNTYVVVDKLELLTTKEKQENFKETGKINIEEKDLPF